MTHLTISKHAAVVASHAIFYHWQTSYFKEILLSYQACEVWNQSFQIPKKLKTNSKVCTRITIRITKNRNMKEIIQQSLPG